MDLPLSGEDTSPFDSWGCANDFVKNPMLPLGGNGGQDVLEQGMEDIFQLLIVKHGFRKILLEFFEDFDLLFAQNSLHAVSRPLPEFDERYSFC